LLDRDWSGVKAKLLARNQPAVPTTSASPASAAEKPAASVSSISYDY